MKNLITLIFVSHLLFVQGQTLGGKFIKAINDKNTIPPADKKGKRNLVTPKAFDSIAFKFITKTVPDVAGKVKAGNNIGLSFNEDKTEANAQGALAYKRSIFSAGFKAAIEDKLFEAYSGKDKLGSDWGANASIAFNTRPVLNFYGQDVPAYELKLSAFSSSLVIQEKEILPYLNAVKLRNDSAAFRATYKQLKDSILTYKKVVDSLNTRGESALRQISRLNTVIEKLEDLFGKDLKKFKFPVDTAIKDYINRKYAPFEIKNHIFTGFSFHQWIISGSYNNKTYKTYNPIDTILGSRLKDLSYDNGFNVSVGYSYFRNVRYLFTNVNGTLGFKNVNNFDDPANKKYNKSFVTDITRGQNDSTVQYESKTKSAFDRRDIEYKLYNAIYFNAQLIALFGKAKNVGINLTGEYLGRINSATIEKIDLAAGPVICITEKEESSNLNFSILAGLSDITNRRLNNKERFFIRLQVNVPVSVFSL